MKTKSKRALVKRAQQRGAAMVEGIVIMTTMLVFLGMNVWVAKAYGGKLDQANSTRRDVLYFASHSCETRNDTDPDTYSVAALKGLAGPGVGTESEDPGIGEGAINRIGELIGARGGGGEGNAVQRNWNSATAGKGPTPVTGTAVLNLTPQRGITMGRSALSTNVATNSFATCNEKRYDNPWTQLFEFGWDFLKSAAGAG